ncbi:MAG: glycosyltransferase, partial [Hyphomicrobiales bacterium]
MQDAELDVVIVTFNSAAVLGGLLDTLWIALADLPNARVIVADNDSRDDSAGIARDHAIGASVVSVGYNAGYSAGINAA